MIETHGRLLDTAVKPLADNAELQLAAVALLKEAMGKSAGNAEEVISRWEEVDAAPGKPWVKGSFIAMLAVLSIWAWTVAARQGIVWWRLEKVYSSYKYDSSEYAPAIRSLEQCMPDSLTAPQRLLLFGGGSQASWSDAMKALWDSEPEDPAFFMEYAFAHWVDHRSMPPGYLDTARRLASENSWPVYLAAAETSYKIVKADKQSQADMNAGRPCRWNILDASKLDERIALLHQASALPKFDTYQVEMLRRRIPLVPMDDHLGYLIAFKILWQETPQELMGGLLNLLAAKSQQCADLGDRDGFQSLLKDLAIVEKRWADSETDNTLAECRMRAYFRKVVPCFRAAAEKLNLSEDAVRFSAIERRFKEHAEKGHSGMTPSPFNTLEPHYPMLLAMVRKYSEELPHPPWTLADLEPGRLADHELLSRAGCLAAWILLGAGLCAVFLFRFRLSVLLKRLSARMGSLLRPVDFVWIIGFGVLLPYGFMLFINRCTPSGGRDLGILTTNWLLPSVQYLGMALLIGIASVRAVRWRLEKRVGLFLPGARRFDLCLRATICAALFIPVAGFAARGGGYWLICWLPLTIVLLGFPLLWVLASTSRALFGADKMRLLSAGVTARALMVPYAAAMLLMVVAVPIHQAMERHEFRKDVVLRMDPAFPAISPYEFKTARMLRNETRAILGLGD